MKEFDYSDVKNTVMETLGIEMAEYNEKQVIATMPVTPKVHQPFGILHGGVSLVLAETVASAGSYQFIDYPRKYAVGLEINANHVRSVRDGIIRAIGTPLHIGRSTLIWDVRIYDEQDNLVCISRCTMAVIDAPRQSEQDQ
ncbi:MAG TPA: hotdog fold thioesterase [Syntrophomonadaceae bacterium]|nr:hotdog fold thioesterase [Syntrophomonadaceae bacterium]